ncbi:Uncharacterised protein [Mycobacteroides abscessus subsp. abscessus]|uniref:hypothetical protein n=1 Tax=Mycobacteroides abscessus TaxID=36809 RepID=UPI0009294A49|nr:hypothetical protein [Mycobacteroides abscessus]MDM2350228.1 hypothetical protein [Mycobacteroides abscessus]MDM2356831.1 hypothetical protein [Mycobacteroides abscessus]QSN53972.1 hypothetical protein I3U39_09990 [Mycobacteroides abscessus subsp. abscessus]SHU59136.1 Uncharacterised protein [Mycobacteroides abscessus subsp. abscessus]SIH26366.1 Uncharacterised protein [Mycobacteroides abscessus subsp. abscessus]
MEAKQLNTHGVTTMVGRRNDGRNGIYIQQGRSWVMLSADEIQRLREFLDAPDYETTTPAKWVAHQ